MHHFLGYRSQPIFVPLALCGSLVMGLSITTATTTFRTMNPVWSDSITSSSSQLVVCCSTVYITYFSDYIYYTLISSHCWYRNKFCPHVGVSTIRLCNCTSYLFLFIVHLVLWIFPFRSPFCSVIFIVFRPSLLFFIDHLTHSAHYWLSWSPYHFHVIHLSFFSCCQLQSLLLFNRKKGIERLI